MSWLTKHIQAAAADRKHYLPSCVGLSVRGQGPRSETAHCVWDEKVGSWAPQHSQLVPTKPPIQYLSALLPSPRQLCGEHATTVSSCAPESPAQWQDVSSTTPASCRRAAHPQYLKRDNFLLFLQSVWVRTAAGEEAFCASSLAVLKQSQTIRKGLHDEAPLKQQGY